MGAADRLQPITWQKTDQLRDELREYDLECKLFDGIMAADSLRSVINVPKLSDEPRIINDSSDRQHILGQLELYF